MGLTQIYQNDQQASRIVYYSLPCPCPLSSFDHHDSTEPLCTRDAKGWIHEKCSSSLLENKLVKEFLAHVRKSQLEAKRRMNNQ